MNLVLNLYNIDKKYQIPFCKYIIKKLIQIIEFDTNFSKYIKLEEYINTNDIIKYQVRNQFISIYDLYRLAVNNLKLVNNDINVFEIKLDTNINIPNSYTKLYSVISLCEYGNLSIKGNNILNNLFTKIAEDLTKYFNMFMLEAKIQ